MTPAFDPRPLLFAGLGLLLLLGLPMRAWAGNARLEGDYLLMPEASDDVAEVIDAAEDEMDFIARFLARRRLLHPNPVHWRVGIRFEADTVNLLRHGLPPLLVPLGGRRVDWVREDGERFKVSCVWEGDVLMQHFVAADGERQNRYRLSPDGRALTLEVRIASPQLRSPLNYRLAYRRLP